MSAKLVSKWTFGEGSGSIAIDSADSNNGTISDATYTAPGKLNPYCLTFNGTNSSVVVSHTTNINFDTANSFSISAWFKTSNVDDRSIAEKWFNTTSTGHAYPFTIRYRPSSFDIAFSCFNLTDNPRVDSSVVSADGNWHHIVGVKNSTDLKIYLLQDFIKIQ